MTRFGRIVITALVAGVLIGLTLVGARLLRGPREDEPPKALPPITIETPERGQAGGGEVPADESEPSAAGRAATRHATGEVPAEPPASEPSETGAVEEGTTPPSPAEPSDEAKGAELARTALAMVRDRPVAAQKRLSEAVRAGVRGDLAIRVNKAIRDLADRLQFSGTSHPGDRYSRVYTVQRGDTLSGIGGRFLIPYPLVMRLNGLQTSSIRAGQNLKVLKGPIHLEVLKSGFELRAWSDEVCLRVYPVALGTNNSTPEGTFNVKNKVVNPPYQPQHKPRSEHRAAGAADNPLGTRWIDIGNHYGIHGTIEPETIGREVSEGCIRMYNRHVEEVFDLVVVGASKVYIRP